MSDPGAPTGEIDMRGDAGDPALWAAAWIPRVARRTPETVAPCFGIDGTRLFWLALKTALLTVITLGIYRFWMITRLRRLFWGGIEIDGDPLEYTGTGLEKFLGFLIAIVVLAVYLGAINLALAFAGLSYFSEDVVAQTVVLNVSILATLPFIFYATYRSQAYMYARTRWRGIRFGLEEGAWAYTGRALILTALTVLTLGIAYPYQHWTLAAFITNRTRYGDLAFRQDGSWRSLLGSWLPIYLVIAGVVIIAGIAAADQSLGSIYFGTVAFAFGIATIVLLYQRYRVAAFRALWSARRLGEARFGHDVSAGKVIGIYIGGGIATSFCAGLVGLVFAAVAFFVFDALGGPAAFQIPTEGVDAPTALIGSAPFLAVIALSYLAFFVAAFAFGQVFVTRPVLGAQVEAMAIRDAGALARSRQRAHDWATEAGGFADALGVDIGAGL